MQHLSDKLLKLKKRKLIIENFAFLSLSNIFLLIYPLITYPYLVKVLGQELFGIVLTSQMLASYAAIIVDFGTNFACTKHVSLKRDDKEALSDIISNVMLLRFMLFIGVFFLYILVVIAVPQYRQHSLLFILMYGFVSQDFLYPRFFFQGIEKMRFTSIIDITIKLIFLPLIFLLVLEAKDYLLVPIIYTFGFLVSGIISLFLVKFRFGISFTRPSFQKMCFYMKESVSLFATDIVCTIKDKFNYFLLGGCVGMSEVVVYDLCIKLGNLVSKPCSILCSVMFPRVAKTKSVSQVVKVSILSLIGTMVLCLLANVFLEEIVLFFLHREIDMLPVRIFLLSPLLLSVSMVIANVMFISFGYNKYLFYSIIVTTTGYILTLLYFYVTNHLDSLLSFVYIAVLSYSIELIYRLFKARDIAISVKQ